MFEIVKLILSVAIIPAVLWAWQTKRELTDLKDGQKSLKEVNSKEHAQVITAIKELGDIVRTSERDNRQEHKELGDRLSTFERENEVQHTILNGGRRLT